MNKRALGTRSTLKKIGTKGCRALFRCQAPEPPELKLEHLVKDLCATCHPQTTRSLTIRGWQGGTGDLRCLKYSCDKRTDVDMDPFR